ncbi:MAG: hypothetical protein H6718_36115 [Polyangiaceae bacterium]|nr:hypothetical protein [Polyangiaceae bacterium]
MSDQLEQLIEAARSVTMTAEDHAQQRESFAFGNANIENQFVTRAIVSEAAAQTPPRND